MSTWMAANSIVFDVWKGDLKELLESVMEMYQCEQTPSDRLEFM